MSRKTLALALLCTVQFMVVLDVAIVNVALPSIQADLGFSPEDLQWVVSAYALLFGGFLLLGGRAADLLGRRRVFVAGLVVFSLASLLSGLAWSDEALIVSRGLQGLGSAIISPAALSILTTMSPEGPERNRALGAWAAVGALGAVAGSLLGGVLTDLLSWEWVFYVNVPVGVAAIVLAPLLLGESRDAHASTFDLPGAALVTGGLVVLVYALTQANGYGWGSGETLGLVALAVALLAAFVAWEARAKDPLVPFSIFRSAHAGRRERRGPDRGHRGLLDVPDAHALHAAGVGLLAAAHRLRLPGRGRHHRPVVGGGRQPRDPRRRQARADRREWSFSPPAWRTFTQVSPDGSYSVDLLPGFLWSRGDGLHDGADLDRRARGRTALRGRSRLRPDHYLPADRRRGRDRRPDRGRHLDRGEPDGGFRAAFVAGTVVALAGVLVALALVRGRDLTAAKDPLPAAT